MNDEPTVYVVFSVVRTFYYHNNTGLNIIISCIPWN
jgi:hypothetical protein